MSYCLFISSSHQHVQHMTSQILLILIDFDRVFDHFLTRNYSSAVYSPNYSLAARLQDNSRPKSPTKVETKRKLQQFTVSGWLIMNGGESGNEIMKTLRLKLHSI